MTATDAGERRQALVFTTTELVGVMAIICVLAFLLLPAKPRACHRVSVRGRRLVDTGEGMSSLTLKSRETGPSLRPQFFLLRSSDSKASSS